MPRRDDTEHVFDHVKRGSPTCAIAHTGPVEQRLAAAKRTLSIDAMSVEVVTAMTEAELHPILLKGPTFAAMLYPEGGRTYIDSDLLVPREALKRARTVLVELGFVDVQAGFAACERSRDAETFRRPQTQGSVDLHWNIHLTPDPDTTW